MVPPPGSTSIGGEHKNLAPENVVALVYGVQITEVRGNCSKQNTTHHTAAVGHSVEAQVTACCYSSLSAFKWDERWRWSSTRCNRSIKCATGGSKDGCQRQQEWPKEETNRRWPWCKEAESVSSSATKAWASMGATASLHHLQCDLWYNTRAVFDIHLGGKEHQSRLKCCQTCCSVLWLCIFLQTSQQLTWQSSWTTMALFSSEFFLVLGTRFYLAIIVQS